MVKILIVEDDTVMVRMYQRVFQYEGFEVLIAHDGQAGVQLAKEAHPDMILMDIMMPQLSGLQAIDILKSDPVTQDIPVMVFTNLAGQQDAETVIAKGAVNCIHKAEVNPKQVVQMVKEELMRRGVVVPEAGQEVGGVQA